MFENLQDRLDSAFKNLKGEGKITELNVASTIKEIRRALVEADVNYKTAKDFTESIRVKTLGEKVLNAVNPGQQMVKIVQDEMTAFMGGTAAEINLTGSPSVVLIAGLQGSGKTTFSGKLALYSKSKLNRSPLLVACDVYRPAAVDQLKVLGGQIGVEVYAEVGNKNPVEIARNGVAHAKTKGYNLVIVDTAGRLAVDEVMMKEISALKSSLSPQETLFVVDAMTGQDAVNTAKAFNEVIDFDGVVLTKLDGDTRGGAALSIKYTVNKPIKFASRGEKLETLEVFHPDRMAQRILGMGDIVSFVEKAQEQFDEKEAKKLESKIKKNKFDFDDFLSQINQIRKMGNIKDLLGMIPGVGKAVRDIDIDDDAFKKIESIIQSMTPYERKNPEVLNASRRNRIAKGSGKTVQEINQFIKQFDEMKKMMKRFTKMGGKGMPNFNIPGMK